MRVFLVGLPGSGKSHWNQQLAEALSVPAYDLDEQIERKAQQSIPAIFESKGESFFRQLEHEALAELVQQEADFVLSVGGGTPCFLRNMELMNQQGQTIWLNPPLEVIASRLWQDGVNKRPLLEGAQSEEEVQKKVMNLLEKRASFYAQSSHNIKKKSPELRDFLDLLSLL